MTETLGVPKTAFNVSLLLVFWVQVCLWVTFSTDSVFFTWLTTNHGFAVSLKFKSEDFRRLILKKLMVAMSLAQLFKFLLMQPSQNSLPQTENSLAEMEEIFTASWFRWWICNTLQTTLIFLFHFKIGDLGDRTAIPQDKQNYQRDQSSLTCSPWVFSLNSRFLSSPLLLIKSPFL